MKGRIPVWGWQWCWYQRWTIPANRETLIKAIKLTRNTKVLFKELKYIKLLPEKQTYTLEIYSQSYNNFCWSLSNIRPRVFTSLQTLQSGSLFKQRNDKTAKDSTQVNCFVLIRFLCLGVTFFLLITSY